MTPPPDATHARASVADEGLPDPLAEPPTSPVDAQGRPLPKGDVRVASWIAILTAIAVLLWYLSILILGGVHLGEYSSAAQIAVWALAAVSFVCGLISLNARRARELAAAGFIAGIVSLLVSLTIGVPTGFQILY
ncbi:hypothetical protein E4V99_06060 [Microbacterium sp. dk485]|uniref:hypothetical protein n=1 Tax=Microbacterium TaxID=33882 RepID=UPI0010732FA0|nr:MULTISPECIES: hypothetical protein [Microbacterium]TFV84612.1 hypothetical protein E4V99_06060 [Microbacterium sp. dk485]TXK14606.1 hypothetical protein FVP99_12940 [Microbacterium wangchenii]